MENDGLDHTQIALLQELERLIQESHAAHLANPNNLLPDVTPRSALSAGALTDMQFSAIPAHFLSTWNREANLRTLIAGECAISLARRVLINHVSLDALVANNLEFDIGTISSVVDEVLARYIRRGMVPGDNDSEFRTLITTLLRGVASSYLSTVWHAIDSLLCVPDPVLSGDPLYSTFTTLATQSSDIPRIAAETIWDRRFGYRFWHTSQGEITGWFDNAATRHFLEQSLVNEHSNGFISIPDVTPASHSGELSLPTPEIECIAEKVVFVLSWLVVEMRALALPHYTFGQSMCLTAHRVQDVANECRLIYDFFDNVLSEPGARREALVGLFWALSR